MFGFATRRCWLIGGTEHPASTASKASGRHLERMNRRARVRFPQEGRNLFRRPGRMDSRTGTAKASCAAHLKASGREQSGNGFLRFIRNERSTERFSSSEFCEATGNDAAKRFRCVIPRASGKPRFPYSFSAQPGVALAVRIPPAIKTHPYAEPNAIITGLLHSAVETRTPHPRRAAPEGIGIQCENARRTGHRPSNDGRVPDCRRSGVVRASRLND